MADPRPPYPPVLSPSSANVFSDGEVNNPIRINIIGSSKAIPASPGAEWKDVARQVEADIRKHGNQSPPSSGLGSPVAKQLDPRDRLTYGKIPMNETPELVSCPHCKRPIIRHALQEHVDSCLRKKSAHKASGMRNGADKARPDDSGKPVPDGEIAVMPPKSKKRKHDDAESANGETTPPKKKTAKRERNAEESIKKEKKKKLKATIAKPKLPVDVEKQCGVFDAEKGTMCARSLTCKSHSMSAKRAVPGRSQSYDTLLTQWQKKNQVKTATIQKPTQQQEAEDVDSEEEVRLVVQGFNKRYFRPMEQRVLVGVRRKVRGMRLYEGLRSALLGAVPNINGSSVGRGRRQSQAAES